MPTAREKFQALLHDLFQFDCADLDFGIYRIMNFKREVIKKFIEKDLVETISKELERGALAGQSQAAAELQEVAKAVRELIGPDAIDGEGNLAVAFHATTVGKRYLEARVRASGAQARDALEAIIYNHLYAFFGRYYDNGDFISKRRYSRREKYAIPYNGEEVYLHWANADQYYVKTGEYFTDYRFTSRAISVHFRIQEASVPQDNVKGDKRFFIPVWAGVTFDADKKEIVVPFEYRPLTEQEEVKYPQNAQETILAEAQQDIPNQLGNENDALAALFAIHHQGPDGTQVNCLEHHLRQYTRRNTSDFFIHKDLKGFLTRELDFYIKNEVLNLDDLQAGGETRAEGWFQVMGVVRAIGARIIEFVAQIEDFQKRLFEKRKFITETQYCIGVGVIPEEFYPDIASNEAQWTEWKELLHIDEDQKNLFNSRAKSRNDKRLAFLKSHPTLMVDTKHFDHDFRDRILGSLEDLNAMIDGLLIDSENFQALSFLLATSSGAVKAIYIDPPYNTDAGPILYKNGYRSSSWIALVENRIAAGRKLLADDGIICVTIDDYQLHELGYTMDRLFGRANQLGAAVIRNNPSGRSTVKGFSICHEYAFFYRRTDSGSLSPLPRTEKQLKRFTEENGTHVNWLNFRKGGGSVTHRSERPKQFYPIYIRIDQKTLRIPKLTWDEVKREWRADEAPEEGEVVIWPIDEKGRERVWSLNHYSAQKHMADLQVRVGKDGAPQIYRRHIPSEGVLPRSWWDKKTYAAREYGSAALAALFGESSAFSFAKSPFAVRDCLWISGIDEGTGGCVLDFFAGSGTTADAVIAMNREDDGARTFILVEMEGYFDTVLLPRIKKLVFTPKWKGGKPARAANEEEAERSPRIVKYLRLESYEDALNNISFTGPGGQGFLPFEGDYLLQYMLKWETRECETFLNVQKMESPFSYKLHLLKGQEGEHAKPVDLPETFAYLLGLHVRTRKMFDDAGRRYLVYRGTIDHREIAVIWRETVNWQKEDYERDKQFVAEQKLAEGADEVFVNGDSFIPNARSLDGVFKGLMFAEV